jgi:hypothetical protein
MSMAGVETNGERDERTQRNKKTRREWATVAPKYMHANEMGKEWAAVACSSAKQGLGIYIDKVRVHSDTLYAMQREGGGKGNEVERERVPLVTERATSYAKSVR